MVTSLSPMSVREARGDVSRKSRACIQYYVSCTKTPRSTYTSVSRNASLTAAELHGDLHSRAMSSLATCTRVGLGIQGARGLPRGASGTGVERPGRCRGGFELEGGVPLTIRPANQCRRPPIPATHKAPALHYPIPPSPLSTDHARDSTITAAVLILDVAARA